MVTQRIWRLVRETRLSIRLVCLRWRIVPATVSIILVLQSVPGLAQVPELMRDGNVVNRHVQTESGEQLFAANEGFFYRSNFTKVFGPGRPTTLWDDERRAEIYSEALFGAVTESGTRSETALPEGMHWARQLYGTAGGATRFLDSLQTNYRIGGTVSNDLRNHISRILRSVNPKSSHGLKYRCTNLHHLGNVLKIAEIGGFLTEVGIEAAVVQALVGDVALARLDLVEDTLRGMRRAGREVDSAVFVAVGDTRARLERSSDYWGALLPILSRREQEVYSMGLSSFMDLYGKRLLVKEMTGWYMSHAGGHLTRSAAAAKASAAGNLWAVSLYATWKTLIAVLDQHEEAQVGVTASTLSYLLDRQVRKTAGGEPGVLRCMALQLQWIYFDRMAEACSGALPAFHDLLSPGSDYKDAEREFKRLASSTATGIRSHCVESTDDEEPPVCWGAQGGEPHVALLLDSSGSMSRSDPRDQRQNAALMLVDRLPLSARVSVIDFDGDAEALVTSTNSRSRARAAIERIDSSGGTNIQAGLEAGLDALQVRGVPKAAILFTDGQSSQRGGAGAYVRAGVPVHVVGLGGGVDSAFLTDLAAKTGGIYLHAATSADLLGLFDQAFVELACEGTVCSYSEQIQAGEMQEFPVPVDGELGSLIARLTWGGSDLGLALVDPQGDVQESFTDSGPTYRIVTVNRPQAGVWKARVKGVDVGPGGERFLLRTGGPSPLRLTAKTPNPLRPDAVELNLQGMSQGLTVDSVSTELKSSDGVADSEPDAVALGRGSWRVVVPPVATGVQSLTVRVSGTASSGKRWAREVTRTISPDSSVVPWIGTVVARRGIYVNVNRGGQHGVRPGTTVKFGSRSKPTAIGVVVTTEPDSCRVKILERLGAGLPDAGDSVVFDKETLGEAFLDSG